MTYLELLLYAAGAFAVALVLPAAVALVAGVVEYFRARRDRDQVEFIVGDWPHLPERDRARD